MNNIDLKTITPNANIQWQLFKWMAWFCMCSCVFVCVCVKTNRIESDECAGEQTNKRNENRKYPTLFVRLINHHVVEYQLYNYTLHSMADDDGILLTAVVVIFSPEKNGLI